MTAVWMTVRADIRSRWKSMVVLVVLVAFASATFGAAMVLAGRTASAFTRRLDSVGAADVWLDPGDRVLADVATSPVPSLAGLPSVLTEVRFAGVFLFFPEVPGMDAASLLSGGGVDTVQLTQLDGTSSSGVERPVLDAGRLPRSDRADEILVSPGLAASAGWTVGSRITMQYADARLAALDPSAPDVAAQFESSLGRREVTIVGLGAFSQAVRSSQPSELVLTTPAFGDETQPAAQYSFNAVDLAPGATVQQVIDEAAADGRGTFNVDSERAVFEQDYRESVRPDVVSLLVFAFVTAATAVVVLASTFGRDTYVTQTDVMVRRALGMTRAQSAVVNLLRILFTVMAGVLAGVFLAMSVSGRLLRGPVRATDPDHGVRIELLPLAVCAAAFALVLLVLSVPAVLRVTRSRAALDPGRVPLASRVAMLGAPVPIVVGTRHAFEPGGGRTAVPVRTALLVGIVATAVAVAAGVFAVSLDRLVSDPSAYGVTWDLTVGASFDPNRDCSETERSCDGEPILDERASALEVFLRDDSAVSSWTATTTATISVAGADIAIVGLGAGTPRPPLLSGFEPENDDIALGPAELRDRHLSVGDRITTDDGKTLRIIGTVLAPVFEDSGQNGRTLGYGGLVTYETATRLAGNRTNTGFLVALRDPDGAPGVIDRFNSQFAGQTEEFGVGRPTTPVTILDYDRIRATPKATASVLALLALLTIVMATVSSVERRRRDFAVLRALGATPSQTVATVVAQAIITVLTVIVVSVPIGLFVGSTVWSMLERRLGTRTGVTWPGAPVTIAIGLASIALLASLIYPCARAVRTAPGELLRVE